MSLLYFNILMDEWADRWLGKPKIVLYIWVGWYICIWNYRSFCCTVLLFQPFDCLLYVSNDVIFYFYLVHFFQILIFLWHFQMLVIAMFYNNCKLDILYIFNIFVTIFFRSTVFSLFIGFVAWVYSHGSWIWLRKP